VKALVMGSDVSLQISRFRAVPFHSSEWEKQAVIDEFFIYTVRLRVHCDPTGQLPVVLGAKPYQHGQLSRRYLVVKLLDQLLFLIVHSGNLLSALGTCGTHLRLPAMGRKKRGKRSSSKSVVGKYTTCFIHRNVQCINPREASVY